MPTFCLILLNIFSKVQNLNIAILSYLSTTHQPKGTCSSTHLFEPPNAQSGRDIDSNPVF